jgi:hypothetical protein
MRKRRWAVLDYFKLETKAATRFVRFPTFVQFSDKIRGTETKD